MDKIKIKFQHCHGIKSLEAEFDFSSSNTQLIYARNGMMKTSFLKTFEDYKNGVVSRDEIEDIDGTREIEGVEPDQVLAFRSFENLYFHGGLTTLYLLDEREESFFEELKKTIDLGLYHNSGIKKEENLVKNLFLIQLLREVGKNNSREISKADLAKYEIYLEKALHVSATEDVLLSEPPFLAFNLESFF